MSEETHDFLDVNDMSPPERYRFMTSVIVPRPIGWLSTRSADGVDNLAPFSFFNAVAANPMLVVVGVGSHQDGIKDTAANIRATGVFCHNIVTEKHLQAMNLTAGEYPAGTCEFDTVGISKAEAKQIDAPYVADCPVVLECRLFEEVDLKGARAALLVGEVVAAHVTAEAREMWQNGFLDVSAFRPVGRLWAGYYSYVDDLFRLDRPTIDRHTGEEIEPAKS